MNIQRKNQPNYIILTGGMGVGKSTVLEQLATHDIQTVSEPARQILAEQREIGGDGLPERNETLFCDLLLSRSINLYTSMQQVRDPVIFDRGIPDVISYMNLFKLNADTAINAAQTFRYHASVFFLEPWQEIYTNDDERKMTYEEAVAFSNDVRKVYETLGYSIIDVPRLAPSERAQFILDSI